MWPRSDLTDLLEIEHPIIQAPMAGSTTPALAAAVSEAGGLGSLGCAAMSIEEARAEIEETRRRTSRPFNVNFFVHDEPALDPERATRMHSLLEPYYREIHLGEVPEPASPFPTFGGEHLELLLDTRPPVVSFQFGLPETAALQAVQETGALVLGTATTAAEAVELQAAGADAVIAQGFEAGGHRGTFLPWSKGAEIGTISLVPQIADAVDLPVIAAGGIADGRGIAAAFALGACGVQIGSAFLLCPESAASSTYRAALLGASPDGTRLTRAISGRPGRALRNRIVEETVSYEEEALEFPLQYGLTAPLRGTTSELTVMWSGQGVPVTPRELAASQLVETLVAESTSVLSSQTRIDAQRL